ncbi:MAG: inosine/xanthosine triphosphatase [Saprospiraceae bacterium]
MKRIIVASKNPTKIRSALHGFQEMFPNEKFIAEGISIPSGVSDQPMGDEETFTGAYNRVKGAQEKIPAADFWVGIEGGNIEHANGEMEVMAWMVVLGKQGMGKARTAGFYLPQRMIDLIHQNYELGDVNDIVFGTKNSKHSSGTSGLLTNGVIDRERFYLNAVMLALIPFQQKELYL